jgi:RNA polymerase sigma-70 factor (ECF subfamily)
MKEVKSTSAQAAEDKILANILRDDESSARAKESAFNQLYSKHQNNLGHYFKLRVTDEETAEDLKMVTFMKAHENIDKYDDTYAFTTWLYNIAKNAFIDHARKNSISSFSVSLSENEGDADAIPFQVKSDYLDPEQGFLRDERIERVQYAINSIDNEHVRELMTERFINDLSFEQIAEKLGIENNSTLRVNILRGKEVIKKELVDLNPFA